jgi:NAD-reducing hydrogenase small subunit
MMDKKKLATIWLGGCSGCHMSLLDMDERILDLAAIADIVKCPVVDGKTLPPVDLALVEGSVTSDEHLREILHIRNQAKVLVALGDCAVMTNITGMRNYFELSEVMKRSYSETPSNDGQGRFPDHPALLRLREKVVPLQEVVKVDVVIPGCPPDADTIFHVVTELLNGRVPDLGKAKILKYG